MTNVIYMVDNHTYIANLPENRPEDYDRLTDRQKKILSLWIKDCLEPHRVQSFNDLSLNSYALKHEFEASGSGFYITNGSLKGAMLRHGFYPKDERHLNWIYKLPKNLNKKTDFKMKLQRSDYQ